MQLFRLPTLVNLGMKINNLDVMVGLYCGFLTTLSIAPSYLFLLRDHIVEEETEKKVAATTGFLMGQLMLFISIYYAPLHLALGRPHTITVLVLPYLLFHLFRWNHDDQERKNTQMNYRYSKKIIYRPILTKRKKMRNRSTQYLFVNHLIFQLFNPFFFSGSALVRLVNINMFRCNNKILFVTSSFLGWLIGFILFMEWVRSVLVWIQPSNLMRWNKYIRSKKYIPSEIKRYMSEFMWFSFDVINYPNSSFSIILFVIWALYLGKMPALFFTRKTKKLEIRRLSEEKGDLNLEESADESVDKGADKGPDESVDKGADKGPDKGPDESVDKGADKGPDESVDKDADDIEKVRKLLYGRPMIAPYELTEDESADKGADEGAKERKIREREIAYEIALAKQQEKGFNIYMLYKKFEAKKNPNLFFVWFDFVEKLPVLLLFNCQEWNRPLRYIKNNTLWGPILKKDGMSQNLFDTSKSDGNRRISFTYPPLLSIFWEMIEKKLGQEEKQQDKKRQRRLKPAKPSLYKNWFDRQNQKKAVEQNKFLHRICALNKGLLFGDVLEKKNGLQTDPEEVVKKGPKPCLTHVYNETTQENKNHVLKQRDPLISGPFRTRPTRKYLWKNADTSLSKLKGLGLNRIYDFWGYTRNIFLGDENIPLIKKYMRQSKQILKKKVPEWTSILVTDFEYNFTGSAQLSLGWKVEEPHIRSRMYKEILLFSQLDLVTESKEARMAKYTNQSDFNRNTIIGTARNQRRKTISKLILPRPRSPFFWGKTTSKIEAMLYKLFLIILKIRNIKIFGEKERKKIRKTNVKKEKKIKIVEEGLQLEAEEAWESLANGPQIRSCLLIIQSFFRQHILFPLLIIAKNTVHFLLYRVSDWHEDFEEWAKEKHILCNTSGVELKENEFVEMFFAEGFSINIKIMHPFSLKPWCKSKLQDSGIKKKKKSEKIESGFYYLTVWGMEAEQVFGSPRTRSLSSSPLIAFFKPVLKKLKNKMEKNTKKVLSILKKRTNKLSEGNSTPLGKLKILSKSSKTKDESFTQIGSIDSENFSKTDLQIKNLSDRTSKIINKIKEVEKGKLKRISELKGPLDSNVELESQPLKNCWKILKRRNVRLIKKFRYFIKIFIAKKYIDIFLPILNITAINTKHFIELTIIKYELKIRKYISNNERNQSKNETTEKDIHFISISTIKKSKPIKKNSHIFYDLSCLSQGYVFLKLSQLEVINLSKLSSVLQYQGTSFFLKTTIKDSFRTFNSELRNKKLRSYDEWKNWLRGHFQYNSPIEWSRLIPQKWRTQVNRRWTAENKDFQKWGLNGKDLLFSFDYTNPTSYQVDSQDAKFRKCYRFSRLLDACLNSETKEELSIYGVPLEESLNINPILSKETDSQITEEPDSNIKNSEVRFISRYINTETSLDMLKIKRLDRKYCDWNFDSSRLDVNDNEKEQLEKTFSDPSNSDREIYFECLNVEKNKGKKFFKRGFWNLFFWFFSEVAVLLQEYSFPISKNFGSYTVSMSFGRGPDNRSEEEKELERIKRAILDRRIKKKKLKIDKPKEINLDLFLKQFLVSQRLWYNTGVGETLSDRLGPFTYLLEGGKTSPKMSKAVIISLDINIVNPESLLVSTKGWWVETMQRGRMILQPIREVRKMSKREAHIKFLINLLPYKRPTENKNYYDLPVPENILSSRGSRKLKILTSLKFKTRKFVDRNPVFCKQTKIKNWGPFLPEGKHRDRDQNELIKLKSFLWPNYRLEDLACLNRYWFNTNNGSRFSMLRIYMYPRLQLNIGMYLRLKLNMYPRFKIR